MPEHVVTVRSFAKINLDLRVLERRPDNYHEIRTIFQAVSLADTIRIRFSSARRTHLAIEGNVDIPNNLILRAAEAVLQEARIHAEVTFHLKKTIPMGAGLGGGSSNAAAVLLALPILAGRHIPLGRLVQLGTALGSDVPFFLYGGAALGIGRGTELYPLADLPARHALLVAPAIHVSTAEAYGDLKRRSMTDLLPSGDEALTTATSDADTESFRSLVWALAELRSNAGWKALCANDFEIAVFRRHPALRSIKRKLGRLGARLALMTGSGSALFGLFDSRQQVASAAQAFPLRQANGVQVFPVSLLTRHRYRGSWRRQLAGHITTDTTWPPRSRYSTQ